MEDTMLVIGLGNPGAAYENTYHNVGAIAAEAIAAARTHGEEPWKPYRGLFLSLRRKPWIFIRPLVFMNESGRAVREAVRVFAVRTERIILIHDDSDLPVGTWKLSRGRGAGGHHGVESVVAALGANDFTRIRIGIRPAKERVREKAGAFVLKKISKTSMRTFQTLFDEIADAAGIESRHPAL